LKATIKLILMSILSILLFMAMPSTVEASEQDKHNSSNFKP